jgi:membrane protein DedA with SNARE-associated domain
LLEGILEYLSQHPPGAWIGPILAAIAFVETIFPPFPGDALFIIVSSWVRMAGGSPVWITLAGFSGCFLGTCILFHFGRSSGARFKRGYLSRWMAQENIGRAEDLFRRKGPLILVGSRFIPGVRSLLVVVAGSSGMGILRALTAAGFSALVWYVILSTAATAIGDNIYKAQAFISSYGKWVWITLGCLILLYIVLRLLRKGRDRST